MKPICFGASVSRGGTQLGESSTHFSALASADASRAAETAHDRLNLMATASQRSISGRVKAGLEMLFVCLSCEENAKTETSGRGTGGAQMVIAPVVMCSQ